MKHIRADDTLPSAIAELVSSIKPDVVRAKGLEGDALENAIKANGGTSVDRLSSLEPILAGPSRSVR